MSIILFAFRNVPYPAFKILNITDNKRSQMVNFTIINSKSIGLQKKIIHNQLYKICCSLLGYIHGFALSDA